MKNPKRLAALLLTAAVALSATAIGCAADAGGTFSDVPAGADYAAAVAWCAGEGLMNGVEDGRFAPGGSLTRAMLATVLYRQAGEPAVSGDPAFTDAEPGMWYSAAVVWASEKGLLKGYGDGLFGVGDPVSREMLSVVMARQQGEDPAWTGAPELAVDATRAEAAVALYTAFAGQPAPTAIPAPSPTVSAAPSPTPSPTPSPSPAGAHILVAYFSATHNTQGIADHIKSALGDEADLFEIVPETPYTSADLNYNTDCRANREQNDDSARPGINGTVSNLDQYDTVFLGYPIWWGRAPKIIYTFLESYSWEGKTVIPFCTSGSSPYNDGGVKDLAPGSTWLTGRRFSGGASAATVADWVSGLDLPTP